MEPLQKWPVEKKRRITWCRRRRHGGICDHRGRDLDVPQTKDEEGGSNQAGTQDYQPYPRMGYPSAYYLASCSCFDESEKNPFSHILDVVDKRFVIYFSVSEFKLSKIPPVASIAQGAWQRGKQNKRN